MKVPARINIIVLYRIKDRGEFYNIRTGHYNNTEDVKSAQTKQALCTLLKHFNAAEHTGKLINIFSKHFRTVYINV